MREISKAAITPSDAANTARYPFRLNAARLAQQNDERRKISTASACGVSHE
jgi:hypothetical protein